MAHPRSRGENGSEPPGSRFLQGSSPLARGKRLEPARRRGVPRLIPARAGKTVAGRRQVPSGAAHPRSRGENLNGHCVLLPSGGSSPLTRGQLRFGALEVLVRGLIPAHAGKTPRVVTMARAFRAHPRSRGENYRALRSLACRYGSSPLTRGKRQEGPARYEERWLIPAHAGKTVTSRFSRSCGGAHPRSRGENAPSPTRAGGWTGSSPLTRGKPSHCRRERCGGRLIPAHAGKTGSREQLA